MTLLDGSNIQEIFGELDRELVLSKGGEGRFWRLVICGGAALLSLGLRTTNTQDIDVLEPDLDDRLKAAAQVVGARRGLTPGWVNNGPHSLVRHLPLDWKTRLVPVFRGAALSVYSIGRPELLLSKLFAEADRQEDLEDLVSLKPSRVELEAAASLVETLDAHPDWPRHVRGTVQRVLKALGRSETGD